MVEFIEYIMITNSFWFELVGVLISMVGVYLVTIDYVTRINPDSEHEVSNKELIYISLVFGFILFHILALPFRGDSQRNVWLFNTEEGTYGVATDGLYKKVDEFDPSEKMLIVGDGIYIKEDRFTEDNKVVFGNLKDKVELGNSIKIDKVVK